MPSLIYVAQGRRQRGTATGSSPAVPTSTGSLGLCYPLSSPAIAEVRGITISNLLFSPAPPSSPHFPCLLLVAFHVLHLPFLAVILPRLSALGRTQRPLAKKCISWHIPAGTFPFSRTHAIWNTALVWVLWQLLHHPSEVAGALNYRVLRFCWTSARREGNTHLDQVTTSGK